MKPLLSVVIPTLDFDDLLRESLNSALDDLASVETAEVIIVRDGPESRIPTWANHPMARVIFTGKRGGAARAINAGIQSTAATYIGRLDADDIWTAGRAIKQISALDGNPDAMVVAGSGLVIDENGTKLGLYPEPSDPDLRYGLLTRNPIIHSGVMFRRKAWERVGGYNESLIRMQDYDFWLRVAQIGDLIYLPQVVVKYRTHSAQTSRRPKRFLRLMRVISVGRLDLARALGQDVGRQHISNVIFGIAQLLRYARLRRPRYVTQLSPSENVPGA